MIKLIDILNEVTQTVDLTPEQFTKRIPFLKTFKNFSDDKRVFFQKVDYNKNKQIIFGDEILTFPQVNTSIEFKYYKDKIGEKYFHNFILTFELLLMPPREMDDLTQKVLILANNQNNKRLSYIKEVVTDDKDLSAEQLNKVINELNGKFFEIENYVDQQSFDIKNPLAEGIHDPVKPGILKKRLGNLSCSRVRSAKSKLKDKGTHYAKALQRYLNYHC
jgi:hypothetical protein